MVIGHSSRRIPPRSALDLLVKNQGHIASGVLQQLLARKTNLGAKLQTLQQVNEQTASHLGRGCASQTPRLYLQLETVREMTVAQLCNHFEQRESNQRRFVDFLSSL